jgi:hypothetical protein
MKSNLTSAELPERLEAACRLMILELRFPIET